MRGSISNDGFSEALSQEEEDRPQAALCVNRLEAGGGWGGGGVGSATWYGIHSKAYSQKYDTIGASVISQKWPPGTSPAAILQK